MAATLTKTGGGTVVCRYLTIINNTATGAEFYAGDSTDGGGNTGWTFTYPPTGGGAGARGGSGFRAPTRGSATQRSRGRGTRR